MFNQDNQVISQISGLFLLNIMGLILKVSFRNLIRQKRRNILLGISIAFGMCILIVANSWSHGLSDILLNRIIGTAFGHIVLMMNEKGKSTMPIIRDKDRMIQVLEENIEGIDSVYESVSTYTRALGNGKSEYTAIVGIEPNEEFYSEFPASQGDVRDLDNTGYENPIALSETMASDLNVGLYDTVKVKFQTVYGQSQSARFTVVAILKADNVFMAMASFTHLNTLKPLMGYAPYETASLAVAMQDLKDPKIVLTEAEKVHTALTPNVAGYTGVLQANSVSRSIKALSVLPEDAAQQAAQEQLQIAAGDLNTLFTADDSIAISQDTARSLGVSRGDSVSLVYESKFEGTAEPQTYRVAAIFTPNASAASDMVFLNSEAMYDTFFPVLPKEPVVLTTEHPLFTSLMKEWTLLERSPTSQALEKKYKELRNSKWRGATADVTTMYEAASMVLQMESVLKMVTLVAVLILFFIILIGVVNTLRMTIRERTREIGTIRAIGMQRADVGRAFMTEVMLLTLIASIVGLILAFLIMKVVGFIPIQDEGWFSIFLVDQHLHFVPTVNDVVIHLIMIMIITFLTAFFPARRAAKMSVSSALRHYE